MLLMLLVLYHLLVFCFGRFIRALFTLLEFLDITSEWLREMFEGDSADICVGKI